ncbi:hypothetical protein MLD38_033512 [Melastoma candidum]|uniref:Uncharacterized protein n=1 Tax=Melastoma candidum TaxID=119954 RepID=A0ACB9M947_9MYRT|nr:hypothetical protein MLD38_033512 [Melastoma candidum]
MGDWERKNLVNELLQGRELTKQLQSHLRHAPSSSESREMRDLLIFRILLTYDRALSMLDSSYLAGDSAGTDGGGVSRPSRKTESPPSPGESPRSGDVDRDNREHEDNNNHPDSRSNRKAMPRWTKRVRVTHGSLIEGQLDDGLNWRKYGQKDILGARFPRGYYRCTYKAIQGCLATKQVQQSDEDPSVFEITYRGRHTCSIPSPGTNPPILSPENQEPNDALVIEVPLSERQQHQHQPQKDHDSLLDFYKDLAVIADSPMKNPPSLFDLPSVSDNAHQQHPPSVTSDFPESLTGLDLFREGQNFQSLDHSELGLVVSAANRPATSTGTDAHSADARGNLEFTFGLGEFDSSFDNMGFFSK